jgi:hypothetical protein
MNTTEPIDETSQESDERMAPLVKGMTTRLATLNAEVTTYIKANPGTCLLGALAAGYIIGRVARRR